MDKGPGPVRYVLYSHYGYNEREDFEAYCNKKKVAGDEETAKKIVEDLVGVQYLLKHCRGMKELLNTPGHEGLLVLFLATGYVKFLNALASGLNINELLVAENKDPSAETLQYVKRVAEYLRAKFREQELEHRVRIVTCLDISVILGRVNAILSNEFQEYFVGRNAGIRYDAPKIVEAILRLRLLGSGVPVLRLDHDVIFRGQDIDDLGLFKAIACAVRAYQLRLAKTTVSTFLFSASYNTKALERILRTSEEDTPAGTPSTGNTSTKLKRSDRFEAWSRAFATRIYPALVADAAEIESIAQLPKAAQDAKWDEYVITRIDDTLARQFYGLKPGLDLAPDGIMGLTSVGAHPLYSVISGALLCLSEGAILDLPPFSNMALNVMWIDDHLKYSLHRAMNHFTSGETLDLEPGLSDARLDVSVTKARPTVGNLPAYVFGTYLPTLLWGTIMDAWINSDSILKDRITNLKSEADQARWRGARDTQHEAPLPRAMLQTLRIGSIDAKSKEDLYRALEQSAVERVEKVRKLWSDLQTGATRSFASYWAAGEVKHTFAPECFSGCNDNLWQGIVGPQAGVPIRRLGELPGDMVLAVNNLIGDTVAYVNWTLEWPRFVQIVRSIKQGAFVGDLNWRDDQPSIDTVASR